MAKIQYVDFDIRIERRDDGYRALVLNSPAGQAVADFQLPSLAADLDSLIRRMGHIRGGIRRLESPENEAARMFGASLFASVFSGNVRACFEGARAGLAEGTGLRLRLRLSDVPELADVPWEFLYDSGADRFLVLSIETPLVRYIDLPRIAPPLAVQPPLDILAMISCPRDYRPLDVDHEWEKLKQALGDLEDRGLVCLHRPGAATLSELHHQLRARSYHVFHFIGHGVFDETAQDGILLFEDESGRGRPVTGHELGTLFYDYRSSMRLAVLNACEGARTSRTDPFAGAAQSLVQKGIPAVIAMQFEISDQAAITLAHEFYGALAEGFPVDAALSEARKSIYTQSTAIGSNVEWGTPVLYMRSPDGNVFDIQPRAPAAETAPHPALPGVSEDRLSRLYDDGLEAYVLGEWEKACQIFEAIIELNPHYQDTAARLEECRKKSKLADQQAKAKQAMEAENWPEAVQILADLTSAEPGYEEAASLLIVARKRKQISELYAQARRLHHSEKWEAALKVLDQMRAIDPQSPDPENLAAAAQTALAETKKQSKLEQTYNLALREIAAQNWKGAGQLLEEIQTLQAGYRETARLTRMVETRLQEEAGREQRQEQVANLYDQASRYLKTRQWEKALEMMAQISGLDPSFSDPQDVTIRSQNELNDARQKAETQKKVIAFYADAQRLLLGGQAAQALANLEEIKAIAPDFPDRQGIRKKANLALKKQVHPRIDSTASIELPEKIGWLAIGIGAGWALVRLMAEALPRVSNLISGDYTFLKILSIVEMFGLGYAAVLWIVFRYQGLRLDRRNLMLLFAGFFIAHLALPLVGFLSPFPFQPQLNWQIGYGLAGLTAGASIVWILHRLGIAMNATKALIVISGFAAAFLAGDYFTNLFIKVWSLDPNSFLAWLALAADSAIIGLFCGWILFAQIPDRNKP